MDLNGRPVAVPGAVFGKYDSMSGDAFLSGYAGEYRGVLFTPLLPDGAPCCVCWLRLPRGTEVPLKRNHKRTTLTWKSSFGLGILIKNY